MLLESVLRRGRSSGDEGAGNLANGHGRWTDTQLISPFPSSYDEDIGKRKKERRGPGRVWPEPLLTHSPPGVLSLRCHNRELQRLQLPPGGTLESGSGTCTLVPFKENKPGPDSLGISAKGCFLCSVRDSWVERGTMPSPNSTKRNYQDWWP